MKRERAKLLLPVIQAWSEGKEIQVRDITSGCGWESYRPRDSTAYANFDNESWEWRIKPEPREFWITDTPAEGWAYFGLAYVTEDRAKISNSSTKIIHVREVL